MRIIFFFETASYLHYKALNFELSQSMQKSLFKKVKNYKENYDNFTVAIKSDKWENGRGRTISFSIINPNDA